jgi:hypothetical protein
MCSTRRDKSPKPAFIVALTSSPAPNASSADAQLALCQNTAGAGGTETRRTLDARGRAPGGGGRGLRTGGLQPHVHFGLRRVRDGVAAEVDFGAAPTHHTVQPTSLSSRSPQSTHTHTRTHTHTHTRDSLSDEHVSQRVAERMILPRDDVGRLVRRISVADDLRAPVLGHHPEPAPCHRTSTGYRANAARPPDEPSNRRRLPDPVDAMIVIHGQVGSEFNPQPGEVTQC